MYSCDHSVWNSMYNQYLQHHSQMTQWFQQLHQTIDPSPGAYCCNDTHARAPCRGRTMQQTNSRGRPAFRGPRHCCSAQARPACVAPPYCPSFQMPHPMADAFHMPQNIAPCCRHATNTPAGRRGGRVLNPHGYPVAGPAHGRAQVAQAYVEQSEESEDSTSTEEEDNSSSEDEIVCNVDAFITLLEGRDGSDTVSQDSFELVDSVEDEKFKFEYMEMDEFGNMQKRYGKRSEVNTLEDELLKKEQGEYLYGERAEAICSKETLMALKFEKFNEENQSILWPVLPLAL